MEGGCCCGYTRYRLGQAPMAVHCCHCTSCQRETGSAFAINLVIEAASLTVLPPLAAGAATVPAHRGAPDTFLAAGPPIPARLAAAIKGPAGGPDEEEEELVRARIPQESGEAQIVTRCPRCLTAVWAEYGLGPVVKFVKAGTLDRAWLVQPDVHIFVRSKREFVGLGKGEAEAEAEEDKGDGTPQFEEFYDRAKVWRPESLERWARLVPEIARYREGVKGTLDGTE